ncbi:MAG: RNA polymerase sigma factor SigJ [Pseudonocardia sp.]|uniref:RNA polymerase sigma factor SigJ n=1 Tax=unclassified Pseudonocardia TaxID=2619320 RepID=UPI00086A91E4|nr:MULTISPECIES: RNA polymerase sigma factor SigJ [unclassified Pseudonocardia]MBN9113447.1 RNA polymerase sigma factor SigJ [Pseudonocardia sp.]ODU23210.1 MAG: RNA polymerase subunit sigma-70 [Pseudonocardia sp. SCN 72-51]ODU99253.1 MAG: RNA polymerase subunit sigma-70 [Pseudonocardia sp. SCN 73-27]
MNPETTANDTLARSFEEHRPTLRAVAYRMLGSTAEAEDAVQEAWLRLQRTGADGIDELGAWLRTIVSRVCLDALRSRGSRREDLLGVHVPDPVVGPDVSTPGPEQEAVLADSVGLAMLVVLDALDPAERLAFVLHDMFAVPFDEIAALTSRSPAAARQLASRARRRVQGSAPRPDSDPAARRRAVDAFFAAAHDGDLDALVAVLAPDVVLRADGGTARPGLSVELHGAQAVAARAMRFSSMAPWLNPVLVNGMPGVVVAPDGEPATIMAFTVAGGRIVAIDAVTDPERVTRLLPADWRG